MVQKNQVEVGQDKLYLSKILFSRLLTTCNEDHPKYVRGIFVSKTNALKPTDIYIFKDNLRLKDKTYENLFEKFGPYYKKHKGFVINPIELLQIEEEIQKKGETISGIFHVHIDLPACPSKLDIETFHESVLGSDDIWYLIVSFFSPEDPDIRAFWLKDKLIREIEIVCE